VRTSSLVVSLFALGLGACDVGTITGGPGPGGDDTLPGSPDARPAPGQPDAMPPDFAVEMTPPTQSTTLGTEVHYAITLTGLHHMAGTVMLTPTGVPASWQATITPSSVDLSGDLPVTADLDVKIPTQTSDLTASPGVSATATAGTHSASVAITVANEVIVQLKDGIGTGDHQLPTRIDINVGTKLRIMDLDTSTLHRIHSDATAADGFAHQDNEMSAGQEYDVTPTLGGGTQYRWYCHDHGQGVGVVNTVVH
jgi:hypothetical protein